MTKTSLLPLAAAVALAALAAGCSDAGRDGARSTTSAATSTPTTVPRLIPDDLATARGGLDGRRLPRLGGPIDGLTPTQLDAFWRGKVQFERRFKPSEGLGPLYNATSCSSCHSHPVTGGSAELYRNFYLAATVDRLQAQIPLPGLPSVVIPAFGETPHLLSDFNLESARAEITSEAVVTAQRNGLPIFGVGLFEFISDDTILELADPDDLDRDKISGRFNIDTSVDFPVIGRFGVKAQSNAIEFFTRGPLMNQMGITSDPFLGSDAAVSMCSIMQVSAGADRPTFDNDGERDPEISSQDLGDLIAFTTFLAPPRSRVNLDDPLHSAGQRLFEDLGCAKCHVPSLPSSRGPVNAYTDLLLHDMGPELADGLHFGAPQASLIDPPTNGHEFRTQPLWGVSLHFPWLHDGRAETLEEAILLHGGEAEASSEAFERLPEASRKALLTFLRHL